LAHASGHRSAFAAAGGRQIRLEKSSARVDCGGSCAVGRRHRGWLEAVGPEANCLQGQAWSIRDGCDCRLCRTEAIRPTSATASRAPTAASRTYFHSGVGAGGGAWGGVMSPPGWGDPLGVGGCGCGDAPEGDADEGDDEATRVAHVATSFGLGPGVLCAGWGTAGRTHLSRRCSEGSWLRLGRRLGISLEVFRSPVGG
jgi:hypothetical protein